MSKLLVLGIDVSKASLDLVFRFEDKKEHKVFDNNKTGIKKLIKILNRNLKKQKLAEQFKVIMESTGKYHILAAILLTEASYDVRVINPLIAKRYYDSNIRKIKSDKKDAEVMTDIGLLEEKLPKPFKADYKAIEIRHKLGLLAGPEKHLQALKAALGNYFESQAKLKIKSSKVEKKLMALIEKLKKEIKELEKEITALILKREEKLPAYNIFITVPGFSSVVSAFLAESLDLESNHNKQWLAFLGMDISVKQSGRWRGRGKMTKRGNAYLRKRLYNAAWGAAFNYPEFNNYYNHLKNKGRSHVEALNIIARKLLRIAFSLAKNNTVYDPKCIPEY